MNRENKRRKYEKGYYKKHACLDPFTCKVCGREILPEGAGSDHRNHCPYCLSSVHVDNEPGDRGIPRATASWSHQRVGAQKRGVGCHSPLYDLRQNGF